MLNKEQILEIFGTYPYEGHGKIIDYSKVPTSRGLYTGKTLPGKYPPGSYAFLRYEADMTALGTLPAEWDIFTTDLLTGCLFIAYRDERGEIVAIHSNNEKTTPFTTDPRYQIGYKSGTISVDRLKSTAEPVLQIPADSVLCCCYCRPGTIVTGSKLPGCFLGYDITDIYQESCCAVAGTRIQETVRFYAVRVTKGHPELIEFKAPARGCEVI